LSVTATALRIGSSRGFASYEISQRLRSTTARLGDIGAKIGQSFPDLFFVEAFVQGFRKLRNDWLGRAGGCE
jgi:hypothetical protein